MAESPPIRVLLIDDHASLRRPLAFLIDRESDLAVIGDVGTLKEARAALAAGVVPDVAVVDLDLPDGDGTLLIRDLRNANEEAAALVLSGVIDARKRALAVAAGAAAVFPKTTDIEDVIAAIRGISAGQVLISPAEAVELAREAERFGEQNRITAIGVAELTPREREILRAFADGLSDKEIAQRLFIGDKTVRNHVTNLLSKLGADSRLQALVIAIRHGVVRIQ